MALDYGESRVGVAVTDPTGVIAQPLASIEHGPRRGALLPRLEQLLREYEVERVVVGLPLHMDGSSSEQAERTRAFGSRLAERTQLPVEYLDERWTSVEAKRALGPAGSSRRRQRRKREQVDSVAAAILLRTWLERSTG